MIDEDIIYVFIGNNIKYFRDKAGLTQETLSKAIGVSRASLANYESGKQAIYISDLYKIADTLNIDIKEILPTLKEIQSKSFPGKIVDEAKNLTDEQKREIKEIIEKVS